MTLYERAGSAVRPLPPSEGTSGRAPIFTQAVAFLFGFSIQFNLLLGGGGEGASAVGGFGYRLTDFLSAAALGLLAIHALALHRILPLLSYALIVAALLLLPLLSDDPRTATLAVHYVLYGFSGLYLVTILTDVTAVDRFCWGLVLGLFGTIIVFILQDSGFPSSTLIDWGLMPGYGQVYEGGIVREAPRYSGLSAHPNEAGHVAALAGAAGAYLALVRHRFLPFLLVAAGLLAVFYYTWSRGGLIAGSAVLGVPLLFPRGRFSMPRLLVGVAVLAIAVIIGTQVDFIASRFADDPNAATNISERLDTILLGFQTVLAHPAGMSNSELMSVLGSGTGGVASPHNGFIYFAGVFGMLPCIVLLVAFAGNLRAWSGADALFALLTLQVTVSFMFEQLPGSYSYALVVCILLARGFVRTRIGRTLQARSLFFVPLQQAVASTVSQARS